MPGRADGELLSVWRERGRDFVRDLRGAFVLALVDEMILVDTGSSDNTRIIAEGYGARVVDGQSFLSKVLWAPGPTDEVFDVLAAAIAAAPAAPAAGSGILKE